MATTPTTSTSVLSTIIIAALSYTPYVSAAVQAVESSNASLPGATKKQLVLSSITAVAKIGEAVPEAHVALISALIDTIVGILNALGVFGKKPVAPVVVAPVAA